MIASRWICLALFLFSLSGCGSASTDPKKDPTAAAQIQQRNERIDRLKAQAAKTARRPAR